MIPSHSGWSWEPKWIVQFWAFWFVIFIVSNNHNHSTISTITTITEDTEHTHTTQTMMAFNLEKNWYGKEITSIKYCNNINKLIYSISVVLVLIVLIKRSNKIR